MRTLSGIRDLSKEITMLDIVRTNAVARPMHMPLTAEVVVASVGHIPSTSTNWTGPAAEYWYLYGKVVHPGQSAEELTVQISGLEEMFPSGSNPQESDFGTNFNVVVVYEALPASQATVDGDYVIEFPAGWE